MKKKVLFLIRNLDGGGAEKVLTDIVKNINKDKFDITVMTIFDSGIYRKDVKKYVTYKTFFKELKPGKNILQKIINVIRWKFRELLLMLPAKYLYSIKIKDKFDVEVAFLEDRSTKIISASNNKLSKKVSWVHTDLELNNWGLKYYKNIDEQKMAYDKFDSIIFVSNDAMKKFKKAFPSNNKDKQVIYNPIINEDIIKKSTEENIKFDEFTIVSVGRLVNQKGYDILLKAHANLVKSYPHKIIILGEGSERENLEQLKKDLNISETFELKGYVSNPYPYMKASDMYISSSRAEGYSLVISEAIILNKAILSTDVTGPMELLDEGKFGIICDGSEEGITSALKKVLRNKELIKIYEEKSKERSRSLNYKKIILEIESLLS